MVTLNNEAYSVTFEKMLPLKRVVDLAEEKLWSCHCDVQEAQGMLWGGWDVFLVDGKGGLQSLKKSFSSEMWSTGVLIGRTFLALGKRKLYLVMT